MSTKPIDCNNHFMIYMSNHSLLHLKLMYSAVCQLYLNKTERKKRKNNCNTKVAHLLSTSYIYNFPKHTFYILILCIKTILII